MANILITATGRWVDGHWECTRRPTEVGDPRLRKLLAIELLKARTLINQYRHNQQVYFNWLAYAHGLRRAFEALAWDTYCQRQGQQRAHLLASLKAHTRAS